MHGVHSVRRGGGNAEQWHGDDEPPVPVLGGLRESDGRRAGEDVHGVRAARDILGRSGRCVRSVSVVCDGHGAGSGLHDGHRPRVPVPGGLRLTIGHEHADLYSLLGWGVFLGCGGWGLRGMHDLWLRDEPGVRLHDDRGPRVRVQRGVWNTGERRGRQQGVHRVRCGSVVLELRGGHVPSVLHMRHWDRIGLRLLDDGKRCVPLFGRPRWGSLGNARENMRCMQPGYRLRGYGGTGRVCHMHSMQ